jgi:CBS domain-containing protein
VTEAMANPVSPTVNRRTTLKDALSMMLDADVQTGIVVDRTGAALGLLTIEAVADRMREGDHAPVFDQAATGEGAAENDDLPPDESATAGPEPEPQAAEA